MKSDADALLAIDIDLSWTKGRLACADCEQGLDRVVGEGGELGVDAIAGILFERCFVSRCNLNIRAASLTSSRTKRAGSTPSDKSFPMPACLPRKNCAIATASLRTSDTKR